MGKHKNTTWGGTDAQKGVYPTLSSHRGEAGDTGNAVYNLKDDVDSLEERILQKGGGNQTPPSHAWSSLFIADMFQEGLEEWVTEAVVLAQGRQSYSLEDDHSRKGFPQETPGMSDSAWWAPSIGQVGQLR